MSLTPEQILDAAERVEELVRGDSVLEMLRALETPMPVTRPDCTCGMGVVYCHNLICPRAAQITCDLNPPLVRNF